MSRKTATVADIDPIFVAVQGHATAMPDGTPVAFPAGARVRQSSGFPDKHPSMWVRDGAHEFERLAKLQATTGESAPLDHEPGGRGNLWGIVGTPPVTREE